MILIISESGGGKSTIEEQLTKEYGYKHVISCTTRKKRQEEIEGLNYYYVSKEDMWLMKERGELAECTSYNGNLYGAKLVDCTDDKVIIVEPNGFRELKKNKNLHITSFYIKVDEDQRIERMKKRVGFTEGELYERISTDRQVFKGIENEVDYIINNNNDVSIDDVCKEIIAKYNIEQ